jgi:hypothetical protein
MKPKTKGGEILKNRRKSALARLEQQLISGVKPIKGFNNNNPNNYGSITTPLTESDIKRINQEIQTLKSRI